MLYAVEYLASLSAFLLLIFATGWILERTFCRVDVLRGTVRLCLGFAFWTWGLFALLILRLFGGGGLLGLLAMVGAIAFWGRKRGAFSRVDVRIDRWNGILAVSASPGTTPRCCPEDTWWLSSRTR